MEIYKTAIRRMGAFGKLFVAYTGCPKGPVGRACVPIEDEVLLMEPVVDVDGGRWIPVNEDALNELVRRYLELKRICDPAE